MKKILSATLMMATLLSSTMFAALPPLGQSAREIDAILVSEELFQKLDVSSPIKLIKSIQNNSYLVLTKTQKLKVDVIYENRAQDNAPGAQSGVGPKKFKLVFHDATPRHDDELDEDDMD